MYRVIVFIIGVLLASVSGWGSCRTGAWEVPVSHPIIYGYSEYNCSGTMQKCGAYSSGCPSTYKNGNDYLAGISEVPATTGSGGTCFGSDTYYGSGCTMTQRSYKYSMCHASVICNSQNEADSVACVNGGHQWDSVADSCKVCTERDTTWRESSCAYDMRKGMYLNIVTQYQRINCVINSIEREYYSQKCDTLPNDSSITCMGSVDGIHVYLRGASGRVTKCAADGSCDYALQKVALGQCPNPNDPPQDGEGGEGEPNSSSSEPQPESSSQQGENSSDSLQGGDYGEIIDTLHAMHVTMEDSLGAIHGTLEDFSPFVSGTYDGVINLNSVAHDINQNTRYQLDLLSDIKDNTGNTASNTSNINGKLNTTNELLNDIKNKNWNPTINVNPEINVGGDTTIVNIHNNVDTSKAPSVILQQMRDSDYNANDTLGMGSIEESAKLSLDSTINSYRAESFVEYGDSIGGAVSGVKNAIGAYKDSLQHGAMSDSVQRWGDQLVNNGVLVGDGTSSCPSVFTRNFTWNMGRFGNIQLGSFGTYLCQDFGLGITLWALARMVLRAMVAITCMLWLYRTVIGIEGGSSNEED